MKKTTLIIITVLFLILALAYNSLYVVAENEYACVSRFSEIVSVSDQAGLHVKLPFIDTIRSFPKMSLIYDIPPSEVLTADKKNMTVDSYILWEIEDPLTFYRTLGTTAEAESRLDAVTYNELKNLMGEHNQDDIINMEDAAERNDIFTGLTAKIAEVCKGYGINVLDVRIKRFDLAQSNEESVYQRMISERKKEAAEYTSAGELEAAKIRNEADRNANTEISNAKVTAAELIAEGESRYMEELAKMYDTEEKKEFYEFGLALDALKASLSGGSKTVVLDKNSVIGSLLLDPGEPAAEDAEAPVEVTEPEAETVGSAEAVEAEG